jgi:hypothetical protein
VLSYLREDIAQKEEDCASCRAPQHDIQADGRCTVCPLRAVETKYSDEFRAWLANLTRLYGWHQAGYSLDGEELSTDQWDALAAIHRWHRVKDIEDQVRMFGASS